MVLQDVIFTQSLFIIVYSGIYISKSSFVATYPSTNGSRIKTFPNTAAGVRKFIGALAVAEHHYVMEATGNYGFLLHHKQRQAHEAEPVAEVLHDDATADEPHARRLEPCKQGVDPERQVEDTAQREKCAPQTSSGDVVARQKRAYEKRPRAESPVVKADLLVRKTQAPGCGIRFEEQRNDLHHEALAQPVQDDEGDIVPDMPFGEERRDNLFQARKAIPQRAAF